MSGSLRYPHPHPGSVEPPAPDDLYTSPPPWDIGRPQPAFLALADEGVIQGRVLDVGCGTGEHALMCAGLGLDATGVDLASRALTAAEEKVRERGRTAAHWSTSSTPPLKSPGTSNDLGVDLPEGMSCQLNEIEALEPLQGLRVIGATGAIPVLGEARSRDKAAEPQ